MKKNFAYSEEFKNAWKAFKNNALILTLASVSMMILSMAFSRIIDNSTGIAKTVAEIVSPIIQLILGYGMIYMSLKAIRGVKVVWEDLFRKIAIFPKYLLATIIYGLVILVGIIPYFILLFFVVSKGSLEVLNNVSFENLPIGIMIATLLAFLFSLVWYLTIGIKYQFYSFILVDKNLKILEAFKLSSKITYGIKSKLLGFLFIIMFANLLVAVVTNGIGLIITIPLTILSVASVYQKLLLSVESITALHRIDPETMMTTPSDNL